MRARRPPPAAPPAGFVKVQCRNCACDELVVDTLLPPSTDRAEIWSQCVAQPETGLPVTQHPQCVLVLTTVLGGAQPPRERNKAKVCGLMTSHNTSEYVGQSVGVVQYRRQGDWVDLDE